MCGVPTGKNETNAIIAIGDDDVERDGPERKNQSGLILDHSSKQINTGSDFMCEEDMKPENVANDSDCRIIVRRPSTIRMT